MTTRLKHVAWVPIFGIFLFPIALLIDDEETLNVSATFLLTSSLYQAFCLVLTLELITKA